MYDPQFFQKGGNFDNTSADFGLISADVLLKMTTILKELRIAQLWSKNKRTIVKTEILERLAPGLNERYLLQETYKTKHKNMKNNLLTFQYLDNLTVIYSLNTTQNYFKNLSQPLQQQHASISKNYLKNHFRNVKRWVSR